MKKTHQYYHAPTKTVYNATIRSWKIGGLTHNGSVIYRPVVEVEIDGVLSFIEVKYPSCIIKQKGM